MVGGKKVVDEKQAVIVKGYIVVSRLPSKALITKTLPKVFKDVKIGQEEIKLLTGYFHNKLGTLAGKFYKLVQTYGVYAGFGYIIPESVADEFLREVDKLKKEYEEYEEELKAFINEGKIPEDVRKDAKFDVEYLNIVMEYLRDVGVEKVEIPSIADRVFIHLVPFALDMDILREYMDKEVSERVEREIEEIKNKIVTSAEKELEEKLKRIVDRIVKWEREKITKRSLKRFAKELDAISKTCNDLGVRMDKVIALKEVINDALNGKIPAKIEAIKGDARVRSLLSEVNAGG